CRPVSGRPSACGRTGCRTSRTRRRVPRSFPARVSGSIPTGFRPRASWIQRCSGRSPRAAASSTRRPPPRVSGVWPMRRRVFLAGAAVVAAAAGTAGGGWWLRERPPVPVAAEVPTGTATVVRTDLSTTAQIPGALGYTGRYDVFGANSGATVTWLPEPGQVINRGEPVYAVDNRPVRLFFADRPAWRSLSAGVTAGPDVRAVEENLVALGHATAASLTVDQTFNQATAAALRRWQRATGQLVTGRLDLGAVSFQPGPLRVTTVTAKVGGPPAGGEPMLSGSSTTV